MANFRLLFSGRAFTKKEISGRLLWKNYSSKFFLIIGIVLLVYSVTSCYYYTVVSTTDPQKEDIGKELEYGKVCIVHIEDEAFVWNNTFIDGDSLKGTVVSDQYSFIYVKQRKSGAKPVQRYRRKTDDQRIFNEVHLYVRPGSLLSSGNNTIGINDIYKCEVYDPDKGKTALSWVFGGVAVFIGAFVTVTLILMFLYTIGASCPFIYTNTETGYEFAGEIYSGAIYAPLERHDYLNLPRIIPENGKYKLLIANELQEIQNTNLTELLVLDHDRDTEVLIDKYGNYQTANHIIGPLTAINSASEDLTALIKVKDSISYCGVLPTKEMPLVDEVVMTFVKPDNIRQAKVFIRARNSIWLERVYMEYNQMLGSYRDNWIRRQNKSDAIELGKWTLDQKIPLSLYVFRDGEWQFCDYFNTVGPMAFKDDVLLIDLTGIEPGNLRLKFEYGTNFWEIDYVGIDYSLNIPVKITPVLISSAITEKDKEVSEMLKYDDLKYYTQSEENMYANLTFEVPQYSDRARTVILHSKGYYNIKQETGGIPQFGKLKSIREPGKFLEYSRQLMQFAYQDITAKR